MMFYFDDKIMVLAECLIDEMKERNYKSYESEIKGFYIKIEKKKNNEDD